MKGQAMYTKDELNEIENRLYDYPRLMEDILEFRREYDNAVLEKNAFMERYPRFSADDIRTSRTYSISDPTFQTVWLAMQKFDHHIHYLSQKLDENCCQTEYIDCFLESLRASEVNFVKRFYFKKESIRQICIRFEISRRTFFRKKHQILVKFLEKF